MRDRLLYFQLGLAYTAYLLPRSPILRQKRVVDAKRRMAKCRSRDFQKSQSKAGFGNCTPCFRVGLQAYDAPERTVACSALLSVVLSYMSAFDLLIAGRRVHGCIP